MENLLKKFFELPSRVLQFIVDLFYMEEHINGAVPDPRSAEQKILDFTHQEVLAGTATIQAIVWEPKTKWTTLSLRKQITSWSCGGQSSAKAIEAFTGVIASASPIYRPRSNFSSPGMYIQEIGSILLHKKTTTESLCPSQNMTEEQMNLCSIPSELTMGIGGYYFLSTGDSFDIEYVAQALEKGHSIIFGVSSNAGEWTDVPVMNNQVTTFNHFVCSVPKNYLLYKEEKSVVIDDSCNAFSSLNNTGQRILTESFIKARVWGILALIPPSNDIPVKPKYSITSDLSYGMMNNPQVVNLQDMLKADGDLSSSIPSTGNYLSATKAAVIAFQTKYKNEILDPIKLTSGTGFCGSLTRKKLQELFP